MLARHCRMISLPGQGGVTILLVWQAISLYARKALDVASLRSQKQSRIDQIGAATMTVSIRSIFTPLDSKHSNLSSAQVIMCTCYSQLVSWSSSIWPDSSCIYSWLLMAASSREVLRPHQQGCLSYAPLTKLCRNLTDESRIERPSVGFERNRSSTLSSRRKNFKG